MPTDVDIPNEVASQSFLNHTGNIAATTIFTPSGAGFFRLNFYGSGSAGVVTTVTFTWTDDFQAQSDSISIGGNFTSQTIPMRIVSGSLSMSASQSTSSTYNISVAVEQL